VVYEKVSNPTAVVLLFHGCNHGAIDWWVKQESCEMCIGTLSSK
jgi:hypothetical protein